MNKVIRLWNAFKSNPQFVLMRGVARFSWIRQVVIFGRHYLQKKEWIAYKKHLAARLAESVFSNVNADQFVNVLTRDGVAFGLTLPAHLVNNILDYVDSAPCYADRKSDNGFSVKNKAIAEELMGKPILLGQFLNAEKNCDAIQRLRNDPFLLLVAARYLGSIPTHVGTNMWWTFPVNASDEDRNTHAHVFHRDVDDFKFFKFFFYLTDVEEGDGAHVCIPGSHVHPPVKNFFDRFLIRRWKDEEIFDYYGIEKNCTINGKAGTGFAEDTLCMHKGNTPVHKPRLLLQMQFALFDYGVQHDEVEVNLLKQIA